ncbi:MAG: hypothetical protein ACYTJ0_03495 [Planctomycetota bacterium]|jgi:hypothetical protein
MMKTYALLIAAVVAATLPAQGQEIKRLWRGTIEDGASAATYFDQAQDFALPKDYQAAQSDLNYIFTYPTDGGASCLRALLGSLGSDQAKVRFRAKDGETEAVVFKGFIFLTGTRPHASTSSGSATADGSTMIAQSQQITPNHTRDRFVLVSTPEPGHRMTVTLDDGKTEIRVAADWYVQIDRKNNKDTVTTAKILGNPDVLSLVDTVQDRANKAGLDALPCDPSMAQLLDLTIPQLNAELQLLRQRKAEIDAREQAIREQLRKASSPGG